MTNIQYQRKVKINKPVVERIRTAVIFLTRSDLTHRYLELIKKHLYDTKRDAAVSLTSEFYPDKVLDTQIFQKDPRGGCGFKQERNVCIQLSMEGGEVKVRSLLVKKCSVPKVLCKKNKASLVKCFMILFFIFSKSRYITRE